MKKLIEEYGLIVIVVILLMLMIAFWYGGFGNLVLGGSQDTTNKVIQSSNKTGAIIEDYEEGSYTITLKYDTNGGRGGPDTDTIRVKYPNTTNTFTISSVVPKKSGYTFAGWFTSAKGGDQVTGSYKIGKENNEGNQSTTLYAHWSVSSYINTLKYDANGGSGAPGEQTATVVYPNTQTTFDVSTIQPTRKGYTFTGWYTKAEDGVMVSKTYKVGAEKNNKNQSATLYAHWSVNEYINVLKYDANGGQNAPDREVKTVTYPNTQTTFTISNEVPTRSGYNFAGWYTAASGGTQVAGSYTVGNKGASDNQSTTLYAHWTAMQFTNTLNYDVNGGAGAPSSQTATVTYPDTQSTFVLANGTPTKSGYKFAGWYTKAEGGTRVTDKCIVGNSDYNGNQSTTLYAHWSKDYELKLSAVINDMTYNQLGIDSNNLIATCDIYIDGTKVADDISSYSKGWISGTKYEIKDIKIKGKYAYSGAEEVSGIIKDTTDVALGFNSVCTVMYDANGGKGTMATGVATYGSLFVPDKYTFTKDGYTLTSWNTKSNGSGISLSVDNSQKWSQTADTTLYAQWSENTYTNTLKYDANGGKGEPTDQSEGVTYPNTQSTFKISDKIPTRTGYDFVGWYTSAEGGSKITGSYTVGTKNTAENQTTVLYAHWRSSKYTNSLKYDANGGTNAPATQTIEVTYPDTQCIFTVTNGQPTRSGYTFAGWYDAASGGNKISGNYTVGIDHTTKGQVATLYAHWSASSYTITLNYNANGGSGAPDSQSATVTYPNTQSTFTISSAKPSRIGYTFAGWYTAASDGTAVNDTYKVGNANDAENQSVTLYAHWTANSYTNTLNYDANGGTGAPASQTATVTYPTTQTTFTLSTTTPTKTGYTFNGWYTAINGGTKVSGTYKLGSADYTGNQSATLYAQWTANIYTYDVKYVSSSGKSLGGTTISGTFGTSKTISAPTKTGYRVPSSQTVSFNETSKTITFTYNLINYSLSYCVPDVLLIKNTSRTDYEFSKVSGDDWSFYGTGGSLANATDGALTIKTTQLVASGMLYFQYYSVYSVEVYGGNGLRYYKCASSQSSTISDSVFISIAGQVQIKITGSTGATYGGFYGLSCSSFSGLTTSYNIETPSFTIPELYVHPNVSGQYSVRGWRLDGTTTWSKTITIPQGSTGNKKFYAGYIDPEMG